MTLFQSNSVNKCLSGCLLLSWYVEIYFFGTRYVEI